MTVRPILFSGPMVRALLEGRKTQTRRVLKPQQSQSLMCRSCGATEREFKADLCKCEDFAPEWTPCEPPSHRKGDLLWVKEDWKARTTYDDLKPSEMSGDEAVFYLADNTRWNNAGRTDCPWGRRRWSQHMPRWASRLTLRVSEVRVQRLHEISEEDACAEGAPYDKEACDHKRHTCNEIGCSGPGYRGGFAELWESLNAKRDDGAFSWASNPWVVAVSFEVIKSNVDQVKGAPA